MRKKVLLLEAIHQGAKTTLEREGYEVERLTHSPDGAELDRLLKSASIVGIRSKTQLTRAVLEANPHLELIGCFCIGTDQVDLSAAARLGTPVFNAPYSNTRSVAELVIAEIVALSRQLGDRNSKAHRGEWVKSAEGSREVRGKTLGIVGYGHIGSQVSVLAEAFGMRVLFFDVVKKLPLGNSQVVESLNDLLERSDFVSLHVPDTKQTRGMIGANEIGQMKAGSYLINASRGSVVDLDALALNLKSGHLAGAAIDVFPIEPASNKEVFKSPLQGIANVILTPHIGGSTIEAQESIGLEVAQSFLGYLKKGTTSGTVNFPPLDLPLLHPGSRRISNIHRNVPGVLGEINRLISEAGGNIQAQGLATDREIGYMVADIELANSSQAQSLVEKINELKTSIKTHLII